MEFKTKPCPNTGCGKNCGWLYVDRETGLALWEMGGCKDAKGNDEDGGGDDGGGDDGGLYFTTTGVCK